MYNQKWMSLTPTSWMFRSKTLRRSAVMASVSPSQAICRMAFTRNNMKHSCQPCSRWQWHEWHHWFSVKDQNQHQTKPLPLTMWRDMWYKAVVMDYIIRLRKTWNRINSVTSLANKLMRKAAEGTTVRPDFEQFLTLSIVDDVFVSFTWLCWGCWGIFWDFSVHRMHKSIDQITAH